MKYLLAFLALVACSFAQVSNGSNQNYTNSQGVRWQVKPYYDVRDSGVDCTGVADSTTAFQTLINTVPAFSKIVIPQACKIKVSGSPAITIDQKYGLVFEFGGRQSNNCDQISTSAQLFYNTAYAVGNRILYINRSQRLRFIGLTIIANGGADIPLDIDQIGATPPITTQNVFEDICIQNVAARNANFVGIRLSNTSISNTEAQHFYRPMVDCSNQSPTSASSNGYGMILGASNANAVDEIVEDPSFNKCSIDINTGFGNNNFVKAGLSSESWTNIALNGFVDGVDGFRTEAATNAISIGNPTGPHIITNDFFGASLGTRIDCPTGCGKLTLFNNHTDFVPANWFNVHSGSGSSGPLVAFNNRNFSWAPTDWNLGAFVVDSFVTTSTNSHFFLTPSYPSGSARGGNVQSPAIHLQSYSGNNVVPDDYVIQSLPTGTLSNTPGSSTLVLGHPSSTNFTPWLSFPGTQSGATFSPVTNTSNLGVVGRGTAGVTSYSYKVVAHGSTGVTVASNTATTAVGNAVLNGTNFNLVQIPMVAGCTFFDVYRTASAGTPGTTGKLGTVDCYYTGNITTVNASILAFNDTGIAGDGTTPPVANTTGQIISTVATGLAPLVVASTTNIANLNAASLNGATFAAPGAIGGGTPSTATFTTVTADTYTSSSSNGGISGTEGTGAGVPAGAGLDILWPDSTAHRWLMNNNNEATSERVVGTYASGSVTTAGTVVNAGTCQAQTNITVTGALTTDNVVANIGAALPATWQTGIHLVANVTAGATVTVYLCNPSAGNITPAATAVFVRILR